MRRWGNGQGSRLDSWAVPSLGGCYVHVMLFCGIELAARIERAECRPIRDFARAEGVVRYIARREGQLSLLYARNVLRRELQ